MADLAEVLLESTPQQSERFSGRDIFTLYPELKDKHDGPGAFLSEMQSVAQRKQQWADDELPGNDLRCQQLSSAAWTLMHSCSTGNGLLSWTRIHAAKPDRPYRASPSAMAQTVKAAAGLYGAAEVGIAPLDQSLFNLQQEGKPIRFEELDAPQVTGSAFLVPRNFSHAVVLVVPMNPTLLQMTPSILGEAATALGYSQSLFLVSSLAEFIRGLGYEAIPSINDIAQSVPLAISAGLGKLSRMNKLLSPRFGAAFRLCKVFTNMPLACDKPPASAIEDRCRHCHQCADHCPVQALSFSAEPGAEIRGPWNHPGHKAWFEDSYKCFSYWQEIGNGCALCLAACPMTARLNKTTAADPEAWWQSGGASTES